MSRARYFLPTPSSKFSDYVTELARGQQPPPSADDAHMWQKARLLFDELDFNTLVPYPPHMQPHYLKLAMSPRDGSDAQAITCMDVFRRIDLNTL